MAAYLIEQIIIHDMEKFMPYVANTSAAIAKYGGEALDVVEAKEVIEGNWPVGARTALVRFPDEASLRRFHYPSTRGLPGFCRNTGSEACTDLPKTGYSEIGTAGHVGRRVSSTGI
jgi:uncharacterized protein (DUF1330 family)